MRRFLTYLLLLVVFAGCKTEPRESRPEIPEFEIEFEDENFRRYCLENFDHDKKGGITNYEAAAVISVNVAGLGIRSLADIRYFTSLKRLDCSDNPLTTLNLNVCKGLVELNCADCDLATLAIDSCVVLGKLNISGNRSLPPTFPISRFADLLELNCSNSSVTAVTADSVHKLQVLITDGVPPRGGTRDYTHFSNLTKLSIRDNQLNALSLGNLPNLEHLVCSGNNFTDYVEMPSLSKLKYLEISNMRPVREIGFAGCPNLDTLICSNNNLLRLDLTSNTRLVYVDFSENTGLQGFTANNHPALVDLRCSGNSLEALDLSSMTALESIDCSSGRIGILDISSSSGLWKLHAEGNARGMAIYVSDKLELETVDIRVDSDAEIIIGPPEVEDPEEPDPEDPGEE